MRLEKGDCDQTLWIKTMEVWIKEKREQLKSFWEADSVGSSHKR